MAEIIPFPKKTTHEAKSNRLDNQESYFQERYGVSIFEFLGIEGDPVETQKK